MHGILYGVGVGPGDPELLTLAAIRAIESCDIVAAPDSGSGEKLALDIASRYIGDKEILYCDMPMTRDTNLLEEARGKTAKMLCEHLEDGKNIAFLTLGDPSVYSTYMYVHRLVTGLGYTAKMIPGVPSFCAAAAALDMPLCEAGQPLHLIPASYGDISGALSLKGSKVIMKSGRELGKAVEAIREKGLASASAMAERCGLKGEKLTPSLEDWDGEAGYFTIVVVRDC